MLKDKLLQFGLLEEKCKIEKLGSGLINITWKIDTGDKQYVLQKINHDVFKTPEIIDNNLKNLKHFLNKFHPNYLFVAPLSTSDGKTLIKSEDGYYRLSEYIKDSVTLNYVNTAEEAFEAAK